MQGYLNSMPSSSREDGVLDAKPLRSLSPMFPAPLGFTTVSPPNSSSFVYVSPFGQNPSGFESGYPTGIPPMSHPFATPQPTNQRPMGSISTHGNNGGASVGGASNVNGSFHSTSPSPLSQTPSTTITPLNGAEDSWTGGRKSASGRKIKQPMHLNSYSVGGSLTDGTDGKKAVARKRPKKVMGDELILLPCSPHEPRESVEVILMTFDAIRRAFLQRDEANDSNKRPDLKAGAIMMSKDIRANMGKRIGPVPGVEIGDIVYFRMELCLIGLHAPSMAGIDYMTARFGDQDDPVAISVVSSGGYENDEGDVDVLIYSGQGGSAKHDKKQADDQKLERGNLALERSLHRANLIRVIRSAKDFTCVNGKIYYYDGLYKIHESWMEKGKSGYTVFKYKLLREPGQPDGMAVWKMTQKWKENPSSRGRVILPDISSGVENLPVCLVNEVDGEKGPSLFQYVTFVRYLRPINSMKSLQGCTCLSVCLPGDANCSCANHNGGDLPYSSSGLLVRRKPLIYECNSSCQCSINCRNRVTQKGTRFHFEVFRTTDRGWGLRSWDPIRAGTFICEYTGEIIDRIRADDEGEEDEYIFQADHVDEKTLKWNHGPELIGMPCPDEATENFKPLPVIISSKNIGNISRFMNHSCSPNVFWQPVQHDHSDDEYPHIMFFAIKHIPPMTELTYDYGMRGAQSGRAKKCFCGSPKCRGLFG